MIVIDIKGELFQVTARRRREMGHQVVVLDPFHLVTERSDSLNPLDLLALPRSDIDSDSEMLASLLAVGHEFARDPFWNITANGLIAGLIAHIASYAAEGATPRPAARLALPPRHGYGHCRRCSTKTWSKAAWHGTSLSPIWLLRTSRRGRASGQWRAATSAPWAAIRWWKRCGLPRSGCRTCMTGKPLSIYIVIPPDKLESHKALLRLWVGTLLTAVTRRTVMPRQRTLFLLDECAQLGYAAHPATGHHAASRQRVCKPGPFWQDLSANFGNFTRTIGQTIVNNSGVLQVFGIVNNHMAKEWGELLGMRAEELASSLAKKRPSWAGARQPGVPAARLPQGRRHLPDCSMPTRALRCKGRPAEASFDRSDYAC